MDIAKIRKKAQQRGGERKTDERPPAGLPVPPEAPPASGREEPETGAAGAPEATPETIAAHPQVEDEAGDTGEGMASTGDEMPVELITFTLGREEFAFHVFDVEEIIRNQNITMVPNVPNHVQGVTSLRGKIIPVIDIKMLLQLERNGSSRSDVGAPVRGPGETLRKIMILNGPKGLVGITVDKVTGVIRLRDTDVVDPPGHLSEEELKLIEGVVILDKRFISIVRLTEAADFEVG